MNDLELFQAYRKDVYYLCYYLVHNAADAEDLCQETFVRALQADRSGVERLKPWLLRIAANLCSSHGERRKKGMWKEMASFLQQPRLTHEAADESVLRGEGELELARMLGRLPAKMQKVLTLRYVNELSLPEIAECLDIPLGTVKSRMNKGMQLMRKQLTTETAGKWKGDECLD
ncbi:RNA polymerase sigma-70 factor, ECF subfamily [Paenibacillus sp. UNCCL117]|uniref:RNA polymerase sigma factor n=1 Tax=unclassified Paenibacillus TaxID=185978 RepID=UPI0008816594|nr:MULTISPECIES: RNA polymerase sigma factor [unclassified Paenibacillus]SDC38208.1 RNA polymerase sigma-70 factor, ECF subfamily [Paenibacillus sp. cl123]SFW14484.1 RNA polymerase sigma-70 factor, ECF subfamily [Paenibacillus sp. UNCCL117]